MVSALRLLVLQVLILVAVVPPLLYGSAWFDGGVADHVVDVGAFRMRGINLPEPTERARRLLLRNSLPPRNADLFPVLADDRVVVVLYVHNRSRYLGHAVSGLAQVEGINETLLIVSHDGVYEEMNAIVESIRFCQVKQIFAPWSPHLYTDEFPGASPGDCEGSDDAEQLRCTGNPDQYGHHRSTRTVALKHHWWWMMNTVWDGLAETRAFRNHILFIEEDHYLFPNAYQNVQALIVAKQARCPYCVAVNAAPLDVTSRGEGDALHSLVAEKPGNVGYAFNRTIWQRIHQQATHFCRFDDYNWDITMWSAVFPNVGLYSLRGPRASAVHFGKCGLHQGYRKEKICRDEGVRYREDVGMRDMVRNVDPKWPIRKTNIKGYDVKFRGWGGWGDRRDQHLCLSFSSMYDKPLRPSHETVRDMHI